MSRMMIHSSRLFLRVSSNQRLGTVPEDHTAKTGKEDETILLRFQYQRICSKDRVMLVRRAESLQVDLAAQIIRLEGKAPLFPFGKKWTDARKLIQKASEAVELAT